MNKISKIKSILLILVASTVIFSCSSDDNMDIEGGSGETAYELIVNTTNVGNTAERDLKITTTSLNASEKVNVTFTADEPMRRLYIAKSENGGAIEPFVFTNQEVDEKADGSVDLKSDNKTTFTFNIDFDTPTTTDGTITYILWATTGRGDFRDVTKRNAIGDFDFGTITITAGNGAVGNGVKSYTQTILAAPLDNEASETFMSVLDGKKYKILDGEEYAALWDFGYYYGASGKASFASVANYPALFDTNGDGLANAAVSELTGVAQEELNNFYIKKGSALDFDTVTSREDLNSIAIPTTERVNDLAIGDVLEFVDNYGNKGLIKVTALTPGDGSNGKITFDIKVQTSSITDFKP
ncbi:hypothetical protein U6A24_11485 [Aquimarina gracilis]|uniref:Uncharacterized protein n=1 Tax=Aquimarina gracilis TaxID=874422 RepID=A0ABU5ZW64_9FLAO|nr:hypothetical protein [Aquimarina gracilis]MEB3346087.1 hypothetical protein [Aquimarina gracilis]